MRCTVSKVGDTVYFWKGVSYRIAEAQHVRKFDGWHVVGLKLYPRIDDRPELRAAIKEACNDSSWILD